MAKGTTLIIALMTILSLLMVTQAQHLVGQSSINAPAVIIANNTGSLTTINVSVYSGGSGNVTVDGPAIVASSTTDSAQTAAEYASDYLSLNFTKYNFVYTIIGAGNNVSGPSGGAAMTLLAISALSGHRLSSNFTITGTISSNGTIGPIGGVYDKVSAAKNGGEDFVLVPAQPAGTLETYLYLLVQDTFNIPLVQVANISQASKFAFQTSNPAENQTIPDFYVGLNVSNLSSAPYGCSNSCNMGQFYELTNFTFENANASIAQLALIPSFSATTAQLTSSLNQDEQLASKGYLYAAADLGFLNFIDSSFFNSRFVNKSSGYTVLQETAQYCNQILQPQMTSQNYEYIISGELRQAWGEYTTNSTIGSYNSTVETTDDVLFDVRQAATSEAWCSASRKMYSLAAQLNGTSVVASENLSNIAYSRLNRASSYGNSMYLITAQSAYSANNFPLAILSSDYSYALANASVVGTVAGTGQLINMSDQMATESTYGVWATQFSNEAAFYVQEAEMSNNISAAHSYAISAYSSAMLAYQISNDTIIISSNLVPGTGIPSISPTSQAQASAEATNQTINYLVETTHQIYVIAIVMLVINVVLFFIVLYLLLPATKASKLQLKPVKRKRLN